MGKYELDFQTIGKNIQSERQKKGITQEAMAEALGISKAYVSQIETGVKHASITNYVAIAHELEISLDVMLCVDPERKKRAFAERLEQVVADCDPIEFQLIMDMTEEVKKFAKRYRENLDAIEKMRNKSE